MSNNYDKLFSEFPPITDQEWEEQIIADLKGADYEKKLIWNTPEGLKIKPYYRASDLNSLSLYRLKPGAFPFYRGTKKHNNNWEIREDIDINDVEKANIIAIKAIEKGAEAIAFKTSYMNDDKELSILLKGINIEKIPIYFFSSDSYSILADLLIRYIKKNNLDKNKVKGGFNFDFLGYYLTHGNYYNSREDNINELACLINLLSKELPNFRVIQVNGQIFSDAGSTVLQELAFSLAAAHEYFYLITQKNFNPEEIVKKLGFTLSSGSAYFLEIAKFRAIKPLWTKIIEQYGIKLQHNDIKVHAVNNSWNKSIYDPYVNMLRTTTEAMAAILGGCDSMTITPFDTTFSEGSNFSYRIARNQQLILKLEAYFDKIADSAGGSYYIENLTNILAEAAWELFKKIEEKGGFIKAMESYYIKEEVEKASAQKDIEIANRKITIVGTNQYPNINEKMIEKVSLHKLKPQGNYLKKYRGAMLFENLRLQTELFAKKTGKTPSVFLFTIGDPAMRTARATFSFNFFGCAGFNIINNSGFNNIEEGVTAAISSDAEIIVICSSDEEYKIYASEAAKKIKLQKPERFVIVAGNPIDIINDLKNSGVDDFIHIKTNIIDFLTQYQKKLNIICN
ncbi:MAG TPA: methylmalonyl-CoA mutase family protein [Bacteroidales bacterium]|nr:methylmalonyl-CoA mutase family protein [Bacteroidales bacterium]